ncbi:MAG: deoxynucleoside kinase [Acidobacteriota bacterium]|nr:deoxynucleoside kinase [Acidobacteriota bacterium]
MTPRYIAIEGPIGVGKTVLAERLAERFDARLVREPTDNPFLEQFYGDRRGSAFPTQIWFLISRHQQLRHLAQGNLFQQTVVSDYLFEKDRIFAYINLDDSELATYEKLYEHLVTEIPRPDLVVYLQARVDTLITRIQRRGRQAERRISDTYLEQVVQAHDHFFFHFDQAPLLVVDTNEINPLEHEAQLDDLASRIQAMERGGVEYYRP